MASSSPRNLLKNSERRPKKRAVPADVKPPADDLDDGSQIGDGRRDQRRRRDERRSEDHGPPVAPFSDERRLGRVEQARRLGDFGRRDAVDP